MDKEIFKFGVSAWWWNNDLLDSIPLVAKYGIKNIEIGKRVLPHCYYTDNGYMTSLKTRLKEHGVKITHIHATGYENKIDISSIDNVQRKDAINHLKSWVDIFLDFDRPMLTFHLSTPFPIAENRDRRFENCKKSLETIITYCEAKDIKVAIETMPPRTENRTYLGDTIEEIRELLDTFDSDCFGVLVDIGHTNMCGYTKEIMNSCNDRVFALHVHDNDGQKDSHLMPGEGNINWEEVIKTLQDIGYDGVFMLEVSVEKYADIKEFLQASVIVREKWL
ncbi:sugar phosphate isomerase/epimerase [bacterium]|nr:sugar phosphate isomerase/epimerase [bacterium]